MDVLARLRSSFVTGLILVAPLAVTVFVLQFLFNRIAAALRPLVREINPFLAEALNYSGDIVFISQILAALIIAVTIALIGYLASMSIGQRLFGSFERGVGLFPLVRTIYFGVRQVSESLTEPAAGYDRVVLVEFPREGLFSIGFVTNEAPTSVSKATDDDLYTVFVPNSPNPTAGALVMLPGDEIRELDMPVRRGLRLLVTTGLSVDDPETLPEGPAAYSPENGVSADAPDGSVDSAYGSNTTKKGAE
ncbi:DUF502 domain-containing protein [Haloferax sp. YSSS75]|uniref:DUF502 domain-containing protein n=1 Tax=Haloferax sp. YSSS75 TaxID=3388564 RepID=UPI00398D2E65